MPAAVVLDPAIPFAIGDGAYDARLVGTGSFDGDYDQAYCLNAFAPAAPGPFLDHVGGNGLDVARAGAALDIADTDFLDANQINLRITVRLVQWCER